MGYLVSIQTPSFKTVADVFELLGPSVIASLIVAVVSVQMTFWYHNRRDKRNALQAFQSEVWLNDMETEMMIHDLYSDQDGYDANSDTRNTVKLATSGYETLNDSGYLAEMPQRAKDSIQSYYTMLRLINRTLDQRSEVRFRLTGGDRHETLEEVDYELLTYICTICGPVRLEMVADRLSGNEVVQERLEENAENKSREEEGGIPIYSDYEEVSYYASEELESMRILPRWSEVRGRLSSYLRWKWS